MKVSGQLLEDKTGQPLDGATLTIVDRFFKPLQSIKPGKDGKYEIEDAKLDMDGNKVIIGAPGITASIFHPGDINRVITLKQEDKNIPVPKGKYRLNQLERGYNWYYVGVTTTILIAAYLIYRQT